MAYFGGGGVTGFLHPSLRAYIDCFDSSPFPKGYPRGGGVWDQDPILMRDFRLIRDYEIKWKAGQQEMAAQQEGAADPSGTPSGGLDIEGLLDEFVDGLDEQDFF